MTSLGELLNEIIVKLKELEQRIVILENDIEKIKKKLKEKPSGRK